MINVVYDIFNIFIKARISEAITLKYLLKSLFKRSNIKLIIVFFERRNLILLEKKNLRLYYLLESPIKYFRGKKLANVSISFEVSSV